MDTAQAKSALRHPSRTDPHIASSVGRFDKVGRSLRIFRKHVLIFIRLLNVVDILCSILTQAQFFESLWNAHGISKPMPLDSQRTLSRTSAVVSVEFSDILKQNSSIVLAMTPRLHMTRPPMKSMICKCPDTRPYQFWHFGRIHWRISQRSRVDILCQHLSIQSFVANKNSMELQRWQWIDFNGLFTLPSWELASHRPWAQQKEQKLKLTQEILSNLLA